MFALCWTTYKDMFDRKNKHYRSQENKKRALYIQGHLPAVLPWIRQNEYSHMGKTGSLGTRQQNEIKTARVGSFNKSQSEKRQHLLICEAAIW